MANQDLLQLAMKAHREGDFAAAERLYSKQLRQTPGEFNTLHMLGVMRAQQGRFAEAERFIAQALDRHVSAEALNNYASVLTELGRHDEAIIRLQRALSMRSNYADAQFNLGNALSRSGRPTEAERSYAEAIRINPGHVKASQNLSALLRELKREDEAVVILQRAIAITPESWELHFNLAILLRDLGRIEESGELFEQTIARNPAIPAAYQNLFRMKTVEPGDPALASAEALARRAATLDVKDRAYLNFALGKAYGDLGRYDESFAAFREANRLKRPLVNFDEGEMDREFADLRTAFTAGRLAGPNAGCQSDLPIFIAGFPRSGTTLIEQMLASHPQAHGGGELDFMSELTMAPPLAGVPGAGFPRNLALLPDDELSRLGASYVQRLSALGPTASRVTDKGLLNFMLLGFIRLVLPKARIIHVRRDPVDTCLSCFFQNFNEDHQAFSYDLGELGRHYRRYRDLMDHWRRVLPQGAVLELEYENLVENFAPETRRILDHCGLPWDERCLEFHRTERAVRTASASQVRQPIYRSSMQRWRRYEKHLGPLLEALDLPRAAPVNLPS